MGKASAPQDGFKARSFHGGFLNRDCLIGRTKRSVPINDRHLPAVDGTVPNKIPRFARDDKNVGPDHPKMRFAACLCVHACLRAGTHRQAYRQALTASYGLCPTCGT